MPAPDAKGRRANPGGDPGRLGGAAAYTGIGVYRWFRGTSKVGWGLQAEPAVEGVVDVVVPSPSGLNRMVFDELVEHYRVLAPFVLRAGAWDVEVEPDGG